MRPERMSYSAGGVWAGCGGGGGFVTVADGVAVAVAAAAEYSRTGTLCVMAHLEQMGSDAVQGDNRQSFFIPPNEACDLQVWHDEMDEGDQTYKRQAF